MSASCRANFLIQNLHCITCGVPQGSKCGTCTIIFTIAVNDAAITTDIKGWKFVDELTLHVGETK